MHPHIIKKRRLKPFLAMMCGFFIKIVICILMFIIYWFTIRLTSTFTTKGVLMRIEKGKLYCASYTDNNIVQALCDPYYDDDSHNTRLYFQGNQLDMITGHISHREFRPYQVDNIVSPEKLLSLQTVAIEKQFSLAALRLLGVREIPDYIQCFKVGSIHRHHKFATHLIIVRKNDYPILECLEIHTDPIRIFNSKCNAHQFNSSPLKKSTLQSIVKKIELEIAKEILGH